MESTARPAPNVCSCSSFTKTFDTIYSWLPFETTSINTDSEEVSYKKFILSEAICIYPFSSTYIYCRFSNRKTADRSMKPSSKGIVPPAMKTEDDASRQSLPSARSLMTLGICLIYTTVLFLTAAVVSRLLSTFKTILKYSLQFIFSTRLKSTRHLEKFTPKHSGT